MAKSIQANLTYSIDTGVKPINETMEKGNLKRKYTGVFEEHAVTVHNGRPLRDDFVLDYHGFKFVDHPTRVRDFYDPDELKSVYYPEMVKLIKDTSSNEAQEDKINQLTEDIKKHLDSLSL